MRFLRASLLLASVALGCAGSQPLVSSSGIDLLSAPQVYTLVNLHPDEERGRLYVVNYQQAGLIPVCSPVKLLSLKGNKMQFQVISSGKTYTYFDHKKAAAGEPFNQHLLRFFGTECDRKALDKLTAADKQGVKTGVASKGMTKQGVIFALGYPPRSETPNLNGNAWKFWRSRFDTMLVTFDEKGRVEAVKD